jgi:hypothetical protein
MVQYAGRDEMYEDVTSPVHFVLKCTREMHHFPEYTTSPGFTLSLNLTTAATVSVLVIFRTFH